MKDERKFWPQNSYFAMTIIAQQTPQKAENNKKILFIYGRLCLTGAACCSPAAARKLASRCSTHSTEQFFVAPIWSGQITDNIQLFGTIKNI